MFWPKILLCFQWLSCALVEFEPSQILLESCQEFSLVWPEMTRVEENSHESQLSATLILVFARALLHYYLSYGLKLKTVMCSAGGVKRAHEDESRDDMMESWRHWVHCSRNISRLADQKNCHGIKNCPVCKRKCNGISDSFSFNIINIASYLLNG